MNPKTVHESFPQTPPSPSNATVLSVCGSTLGGEDGVSDLRKKRWRFDTPTDYGDEILGNYAVYVGELWLRDPDDVAQTMRVMQAHRDAFASFRSIQVYGMRQFLEDSGGESCVQAILDCPFISEEYKDGIRFQLAEAKKPHPPRPKYEPKKGFVYLMRHGINGKTKIGFSKNPQARERTLQAEDPMLDLLFYFEGTTDTEAQLHQKFAAQRVRGEWFDLSEQDIGMIKFAYT